MRPVFIKVCWLINRTEARFGQQGSCIDLQGETPRISRAERRVAAAHMLNSGLDKPCPTPVAIDATRTPLRSCCTVRRGQDQFGKGLDGTRAERSIFGVLHHTQAAPQRNSRARLSLRER